MSNQTQQTETKNRKALYISIAFHVAIIIALLIILPFWKHKQRDPVKIQEVELFTPPPTEQKQTEEQTEQKEPIVEQKETEPEVVKPVEKPKPKRPAPEPLQSDLKNKIIKQWDTIEKKNLQNQ